MLRCNCGCETFLAHQRIYVDIYVDSSLNFASNLHDDLEKSIYEADNPYGPYTCKRCSKEYDDDSGEMIETSPGLLSDITGNSKTHIRLSNGSDCIVTLNKIAEKSYKYKISNNGVVTNGKIDNTNQPPSNILLDLMMDVDDDYIIIEVNNN